MLAIAGKFPGAGYTDARHSAPPAGDALNANLGRLPVLDVVVDGKKTAIGQSKGIYTYIASTHGLFGSSPLEAAQIVAFDSHMTELGAAYAKHVPWGTVPSEETLTALFDDATANDLTGPADSSKSASRNIRWFAGRMEALVGDDGFAVGGKLSLADVLIFARFGDCLPEAGNEKVAKTTREPFGSLERTQKLLAAHPRLAKIVANVAANAGVQKWLAMRGSNSF